MVQVLNARPSFGSKFTEAFNPAFKQGLNRFLDESREDELLQQQAQQDQQKQNRLLEERKATAKALGLPEAAIEPQVQAALLKEQAKDKRNQALLERLSGIGQGQGEGGQGGMGGLGDTDILGIGIENPQLAGLIQRQKEAAEKMNLKKEEIERKPIEKSVEGFFTKLQEDADKIPGLELSLESMLDAVNRGDVDPFSSAHLAELATALGAPESLTRIFQTPGSKEFNTARKSFLSSTLKDAFRGATTGKEIELAESLLAQVGVKPEANQAALFLLQSDLMVRQEKQRLAQEAQQKGISNYKIPDYVNTHLKPFQKQLSKEYIEAIREISKKK